MTATTLAKQAYGAASINIRTPRATEYDTFARITHAMIQAAKRGKSGFPDLAKAIHDNRQLWTLVAGEVADDDNALPQDLRARIFYLAEFTQHYSRQVLNSGASISPLVEVNAAIMRGLSTGGPGK